MAKKITFIYALFWILLLITGLLIDKSFLLSSQVAFFSSIFVLFVSYNSYKKKVLKKLQTKQYENMQDQEDNNQEEITLKSEKERLKANKTKLKDLNLTTAFVPYRLLAYTSLVIGFIALKRYEMLSISGFLIALLAMPLGAISFGIIQNSKEKKDV